MKHFGSSESPPFLCAYSFLPDGRSSRIEMGSTTNHDLFRWIHLDRTFPAARDWLREKSGLPSLVCDALLAEETRPRCEISKEGLLLILRGVNLNPGADPEDMISLRLWSDGEKVISLRGLPVLAIADVEKRIYDGGTFSNPGELVAFLASRLIERASPTVESLQDQLDAIEESLVSESNSQIRTELSDVRRQAVSLRRYLAPQREVLSRLSLESIAFFTDQDRSYLRESTDRVTRYVEDLDAIRERAAVTQEELLARSQDRLNRNTYILSIIAAIFLPLGFLTGLLGINVGGIPGTESSFGFLAVCAILLAIGLLELLFLYWRKWF